MSNIIEQLESEQMKRKIPKFSPSLVITCTSDEVILLFDLGPLSLVLL